jgi:D-alanyl-D-alanine carboxypeptidase
MIARKSWHFIPLIVMIFLAACQSQAASTPTATMTASPSATYTSTFLPPTPTITTSPVPSPLPSPTLFPLPTPDGLIVACDQRRPSDDDWFAVVTAAFGLAHNYAPGDLVQLDRYVSGYVAMPDLLLRREAAESMGKMVAAMKAAGLAPTVLSAYRDYTEQYIAYQHWLAEDPAHASQVSALPGHSEHQLGAAVDFGSPELPALTGDPTAKFSPLFAQTGEGQWLAAHAHKYGFTLSNPPDAQPWTGLTYEPWHYRYVAVDMATYLRASGSFLTKIILQAYTGLPCLPGP